MTSSLVGSEMCIRDRVYEDWLSGALTDRARPPKVEASDSTKPVSLKKPCLLYTSDAADDM
eukprot:1267739-Prorocentrum_lima.AAC.1